MTLLAGVAFALMGFKNHKAMEYSKIAADEEVLFFPTSGSFDPESGEWSIPINGWVFERETDSIWRSALFGVLISALDLDENAAVNEVFRRRAGLFLVDSESGKKLSVRIGGKTFCLDKSTGSGQVAAVVKVEKERFHHTGGITWADFETVLPPGDGRKFSGQVQLVSPEGVSVISDIDDTVKKSEVLDKSELLANTFLRKYEAIPGMAAVYRKWEEAGASFHYVSLSPWQLYPSLAEFIKEQNFPLGSFHLRTFRLTNKTVLHILGKPEWLKPEAIEEILSRYPKRKFILVGDSGEMDPEVYGEVARKHPDQIVHIAIRNVTGQTADDSRYKTAFADIPTERWTIFSDPANLTEIAVSPAGQQPTSP